MKKNSSIFILGKKKYLSDALKLSLEKNNFKKIYTNYEYKIDINNLRKLENFYLKYKPKYIFFLGGEYGSIQFNISKPASLMMDNMIVNSNIFYLSSKYKVLKLLFLSSSCVYPKNSVNPLLPKSLLTGSLESSNQSYAISKLAGIELCRAYNIEHKNNFICAIPSTMYGVGEIFSSSNNSHVVTDLIKKFYKALMNNDKEIILWGSGKPVRDFIYLDDLASALIFLMKKYDESIPINIGNNEYFSINQIAYMIKNCFGFKGKIIFDKNYPDGAMKKILNSSHLFKLGWKNKYTTKRGILKTSTWYQKVYRNNQ